jgi:hypothetical protein
VLSEVLFFPPRKFDSLYGLLLTSNRYLGPDHATTDGALIIDPPVDFPFESLTSAWDWALDHRKDTTAQKLNVIRFDVKLGISMPKPRQWAPFFIIIVPEFPQSICIVPIRSYINFSTVIASRGRVAASLSAISPLRIDHELVYNNVLAPFCVHKDDIYDALVSIADASINNDTYINPSNGVTFSGWDIPPPEPTLVNTFKVHETHQANARDAVEKFQQFVRTVPGMHLAMNPVMPLICDMILVDEDESVSYHIEHKSYAPEYNTKALLERPVDSWMNEKQNWHFLFCQSGDDLVIYTRSGQRDSDSAVTKPLSINMTASDSITTFADTIRNHGRAARLRLSTKWKSIDTYDDTVAPDDDHHRSTSATPSSHNIVSRMFREKINSQCCQLRQYICVPLNNHPCADAVMIEHIWTDEDVELYESSGLVPVSLATTPADPQRGILIKLVPHILPPKTTSTSNLFEPAWGAGFDVPTCTAHDFIYVAMSGGITTTDRPHNPDTICLLPSVLTDILGDRVCQKCQNPPDPREWTETKISIRNEDLGMQASRFSLAQYPCLDSDAKPLERVYSFQNGSVHAYFNRMFEQSNNRIVTTVQGSRGILQTQWNHGDKRVRQHSYKTHPTHQ